jgi:hypothetical protein
LVVAWRIPRSELTITTAHALVVLSAILAAPSGSEGRQSRLRPQAISPDLHVAGTSVRVYSPGSVTLNFESGLVQRVEPWTVAPSVVPVVQPEPKVACALRVWRVDPNIDRGIHVALPICAADAKIRRIVPAICAE